MIRVHKNESFPIMVSLVNEATGVNAPGETVYYDVRDVDDSQLYPHISGILPESTVTPGIYRDEISIPEAGTYVWYATCSGFPSGSEEIIVDEYDTEAIVSSNRHYNISVEDVLRTTVSGNMTASQISRNVPYGKTDYILTKIKADNALDWSNPVASGCVYAHYRSLSDELPYLMGGPF